MPRKNMEQILNEVEIAVDEKGCPIIQNQDGSPIIIENRPLPQLAFYGASSECKDGFHGKAQFLKYMSVLYDWKLKEHLESKDPKKLKAKKIAQMKALIAKMELELDEEVIEE